MSNMPSSREKLKSILFLSAAPMAGISTPIFRTLCRQMGATLSFSEMISAKGLVRENIKTSSLLAIGAHERPVAAQIFGSDPAIMADAAVKAEEAGFDLVDINMGCPVRKVVTLGAGCALMKQPVLAAKIVEQIVQKVSIPVTAKIRAGWSVDRINAISMAERLEAAGLAALTIHPRTRDQGYGGKADWSLIARVKREVTILVVGNGDVVDGASALKLKETAACDGIMIGRAALGNPWIFQEVFAALKGLPQPEKPGKKERYRAFLTHLRGVRNETGRHMAVHKMKKFASWYIKGCRGASKARRELHGSGSAKEMIQVVKQILSEQEVSSK